MVDVHDVHRMAWEGAAVCWPFTGLSTILVIMRTFSRYSMRKQNPPDWDDLIISVSFIFNLFRAAVFQVALNFFSDVDPARLPETIPNAEFWVNFTDAWAFISIVFPKLAIAILIVRVFRPKTWLRVCIVILCISLVVLAIVGIVIVFVQCDPPAGAWNPWKHPDTVCWNRRVLVIYACSVSGLSSATDVAFALYPGWCVWSLQMPTWKKLSTMALMGLGLAAGAFGFIKLYSNTRLLTADTWYSLLWTQAYVAIWNGVENDFVLMATCLPLAPQFFRICKRWLNGKNILSTSSNANSSGASKSFTQPSAMDNDELELQHLKLTSGTSIAHERAYLSPWLQDDPAPEQHEKRDVI